MNVEELVKLYNKLTPAQRGGLLFVLQLLNTTLPTNEEHA